MEKYKIIELPISVDFQNRSKIELKEYYQWYLDIMPTRIEQLVDVVKSTDGFTDWKSNYSPDSLNKLGEWFYKNVKTRKREKIEKDKIYSNSPGWFKQVEIENWELTDLTFSLSIDIGMYLSNVFLKNNHGLKWIHYLNGRKNDADYGQPVLSGFEGGDTFNPTQICITLAYGIARKNKDENRLRELYNIWCKYI